MGSVLRPSRTGASRVRTATAAIGTEGPRSAGFETGRDFCGGRTRLAPGRGAWRSMSDSVRDLGWTALRDEWLGYGETGRWPLKPLTRPRWCLRFVSDFSGL